MIPELCSWLKGVCRAKGISSMGTGGAHRTLVSWSPAPAAGVTLDCSRRHHGVTFPMCCVLFLQVISRFSPTVPCWVGKASTWDRHPPKKSLRSSFRSRHSLHPSCPFPGGEHVYFVWSNIFLPKGCCFREKKRLKTVSSPLPK